MNRIDYVLPWAHRRFEEFAPLSRREILDSSGNRLVQVCSTQYLGITWNPEIRDAFQEVLATGSPEECGSLGSNYLGGTHPLRVEFERQVAEEVATESALAFASGWAANYAISEVCCRICDLIISDRRSHNSVIHGLRKCGASVEVLDLTSDDWISVLNRTAARRIALLNPSLEGGTGSAVRVSIPKGVRDRILWIQDECHSFGAIGKRGTEHFETSTPDLRVLGFSKAFGTVGAAVCGSVDLVDLLAQVGSPWIFSTAVPPLWWRLNSKVLPIIVKMEQERSRIHELAETFRRRFSATEIRVSGAHHISGVHLRPSTEDMFESSLRRLGFLVKVSRFPTRPKEDPCARIVFSPDHTIEDVNRLADEVLRVLSHKV